LDVGLLYYSDLVRSVSNPIVVDLARGPLARGHDLGGGLRADSDGPASGAAGHRDRL